MPPSGPPAPSNGLPGSPGRVDALTTACRPFIDPSRPKFWKDDAAIRAAMDLQATFEERRGFCWAFGRPLSTGFTTILPPNSEACVQKEAPGRGAVSASSQQHGGVHILLFDGSVNFISDSIDIGDLSVQPVK